MGILSPYWWEYKLTQNTVKNNFSNIELNSRCAYPFILLVYLQVEVRDTRTPHLDKDTLYAMFVLMKIKSKIFKIKIFINRKMYELCYIHEI